MLAGLRGLPRPLVHADVAAAAALAAAHEQRAAATVEVATTRRDEQQFGHGPCRWSMLIDAEALGAGAAGLSASAVLLGRGQIADTPMTACALLQQDRPNG